MGVGEHSCNSQTSEGSDSTLLAADLHSPFVPQSYTAESKSQVKSRETEPSFELDNDVRKLIT